MTLKYLGWVDTNLRDESVIDDKLFILVNSRGMGNMSRVAWSELKTKKQWKKELQKLLCTNDYAVVHAMERIWDLQTDAEKLSGQALAENGVGFNRVDSIEIKKYVEKHAKQSLDAEDIRVIRSIMLKYWKQLMKLSKLKLEKEKREDVGRAVSQEAAEVEAEEASDSSLLHADGIADCAVSDLPSRDL